MRDVTLGYTETMYHQCDRNLPLASLVQDLNLLLEIGDDLLVLLLQNVRSLLGLQVHIVEQLAQLQQLNVTVAVDIELRLGAALGLLQALGHLDDLDAEIGLLAFDLRHDGGGCVVSSITDWIG